MCDAYIIFIMFGEPLCVWADILINCNECFMLILLLFVAVQMNAHYPGCRAARRRLPIQQSIFCHASSRRNRTFFFYLVDVCSKCLCVTFYGNYPTILFLLKIIFRHHMLRWIKKKKYYVNSINIEYRCFLCTHTHTPFLCVAYLIRVGDECQATAIAKKPRPNITTK